MVTMAPQAAELIRDFVNTYDLSEAEDDLATPAALAEWLVAHGLLNRRARPTARDVHHAVELREALRMLLRANNGERVETRAPARVLDAAARRGGIGLRFADDGSPSITPSGDGVDGALGRIVSAVARAMDGGTWQRLKACRADDCHWAFYDGARNQSRTWCSMSVCGNREKARAYRERHSR